jgi:hypothetical protein
MTRASMKGFVGVFSAGATAEARRVRGPARVRPSCAGHT